MIERLSAKPTASIPQACGDWADTMGAYRFFGNEEIEWEGILAPHIESSVARMAAHEVVLCIQDTTELDFNGQEASGLGPLPDGQGGFVQATCLVAKETEPPAADKPIEWRLLTNLPVDTLEQAARMIDWYRSRWEIEMFFHVLKNGCRIEALQLGCVDKIERALVLYMVVAWRIARLMRLGRSCPDLDAQLMFEPDEWKAAYILNKQKLPDNPPTLNEVVRLVARLGGFLARTGDGEPGVKTIWLGMQRILDFAAGIRFSRELQAQGTCV